MTEFSRAAKRPHWPREKAMRILFECAGIGNPHASSWKWENIFFIFTCSPNFANKSPMRPVQLCFMIEKVPAIFTASKHTPISTMIWCRIFQKIHVRNSSTLCYERCSRSCFWGVILYWVWFIPFISWPLR